MQNGKFIQATVMNTGDTAVTPSKKGFCKWVCMVILLCFVSSAFAIDNPDAPDHISEFLNRAKPFEHGIEQPAHTTQGYIKAYAEYERFLDDELDAVYAQLMAQLDGEAKKGLRDAQQAWLRYREQEFKFIRLNWNSITFGSSSVISRGDYRTAIIKDRVLLLLHYLQNY